jgi:hypothetical protein
MKCIKSIKATKNTEIGVFARINEIEAENKVKTGYWSYVPKSEYKNWKKGTTIEEEVQQTEKETKKIKTKKKN